MLDSKEFCMAHGVNISDACYLPETADLIFSYFSWNQPLEGNYKHPVLSIPGTITLMGYTTNDIEEPGLTHQRLCAR